MIGGSNGGAERRLGVGPAHDPLDKVGAQAEFGQPHSRLVRGEDPCRHRNLPCPRRVTIAS
jgi:hypothetical protein